APPDLSQFAGAYRHYRWAFTTVEKMLQLTSEFAVKDTGKGTLLVIGRLSPGEYAPVDGSGLFRHVTTGELLSLAPGYGGRMTLNQGTFPFVTAFKLQSWETQAFNALAYWVFVIGLAGLGVLGLVTAIGALRGAAAGPAVGYVGLAIALLACGVGFYVFISIAQSLSELDVQAGPPEIGKLLLGIPIAAAGIALAYVIGAVTGVSRPRSLGGWAFAVIGLAALAAFLTYLHFWNGIGWNFP
ncbi:hypothetical protein, partial [Aphanothece microscopica]|uniref:hypothetical protein n=1 Tax=Aphanothece microscopica TaxID=1049561 RepID=UPI003984E21F